MHRLKYSLQSDSVGILNRDRTSVWPALHCSLHMRIVHTSVHILVDLFLSVGGDSIPHMHILSVGIKEQCSVQRV